MSSLISRLRLLLAPFCEPGHNMTMRESWELGNSKVKFLWREAWWLFVLVFLLIVGVAIKVVESL